MIAADGGAVGTLIELFISADDWRIEAIRIELRDDIADRIGAKRSFFHRATIELPITVVQSVSDTVVLAVDVDHLHEAHRPPAPADAPPQHVG